MSRDHPRYESLKIREKLVDGFKAGIVCAEGLIAHGRGEAFDYLVGEKTIEPVMTANRVAVAMMLAAKHPVISVNGNTAALAPEGLGRLSVKLNAPLEVNLFHRTEERVEKIIHHLEAHGAKDVLGKGANARIPNISHERAKVDKDGIYKADVVLVPLEDGDRCEALVNMGKTVIVVDLNPLSRTAQAASITIVDNVVRAVPNMIKLVDEMMTLSKSELEHICASYDNKAMLENVIRRIKMI
ncbi:MAG: 4-phosphopantoate--beta-alanine ligase [Methanosarcinales archaeon Met12]|nr:MAG: 4-phosphopantoate--beta-alanine ligase [Methanosarcinales archaeon Met12]